MKLKSMRFLSLLSTALALGPALAHLPELPNKINLSGADYLTAQQIYRGWEMLEIVVAVAFLSVLYLTIIVRNHPKAFTFTLIALLCIVGAQIVFWKFTYPVNLATNNWTLLPAGWQELRQQWEYSHAAGVVLNLVALVALIISVLVNGSSKKVMRMSAEYFPAYSKYDTAQARFLQDVVAFHSSWYEMALDEFREANKIEPDVFHDGLPSRGGSEKLPKFTRGVTTAAVAICFIASTALIESGAVSQVPNQPRQMASKATERKSGGERSSSPAPARLNIGRKIMWREPVDLKSRDLFYGIGGRKGAPDPSAPFTFVKHSESGTQKKVIVKDVRGREWTVKFGREARPETVATRIVWAVGYHVDQDYFVKHARIVGKENIDARDVRFERRDDGFEEEGNWSWKENPFVGTRELEGLKVLMALLKNWDVKSDNNEIVRSIRPTGQGQSGLRIYYVSDLGASLGQTGTFLNRIPFFADLPAAKGFSPEKSKGHPEAFADEKFIKKVEDGEVIFHHRRSRGRSMLKDIPVSSARWMGGLLGRLSDKQLTDAVRAGGFNTDETALYIRVLRERIKQLQTL